jgi:transmembrane sensor
VINPIDDDLLDRYVSGECSQEEVASVLQWAGNDPGRQARIARARALSDAVRSFTDQWDVDRAWARAQSVIHSAESTARARYAASSFDDPGVDLGAPAAALPGPREWRRAMARYTVAFAACLALGAGIVTWRVLIVRRALSGKAESIVTGPRQRVSVQLRDGSHVILGPESRLVEAAQFGTGTREVDLEGAAYFDVVHEAGRPFVVVARNLRVRDLGTRFSVEAYASNSVAPNPSEGASARVAVAAGSVAIEVIGAGAVLHGVPGQPASTTDRSVVVGAGSVGRVDVQGRISVDRPTNVSQYVSWTSGTLTLDDVPLSEAVIRLEHWYGVTIRLEGPALPCRHITAVFHDESLTDALDELSLALHLRHIDTAGSITLTDSDTPPDDGARSNRPPVALDACEAFPHTPAGSTR